MNTDKMLSSAGETVEYAKIYMEQQAEYLRLETAKKMAKTTAGVVTVSVISFLAFMVILFISVAIGFFLGQAWGSYGWAFMFLTMLYALAALIVFYFKKEIITKPMTALIIKEILD